MPHEALVPVVERFLQLVRFGDTTSIEPKEGEEVVTSQGQINLGDMIIEELLKAGVSKGQILRLKDYSFLVHFPPTPGFDKAPHICFNAHLDTCPDAPGLVNPLVHHYEDGDLALGQSGLVIPAKRLRKLTHQVIITSDGTSLLGADDKAGVAIMMETIVQIRALKKPHGPLTFWFCVNEEIGSMDIGHVPDEIVKTWDLLWSLDGENVGPVDDECFYGRSVGLVFHGTARTAQRAAMDFWNLLTQVYDVPMKHEPDSKLSFVYVQKGPAGMTATQAQIKVKLIKGEAINNVCQMAGQSAGEYGCRVNVEVHPDEEEVLLTFHGRNAHIGVAGPQVKAAHYATMDFWYWLVKRDYEPMIIDDQPDGANAGVVSLHILPRSFKADESQEMSDNIVKFAQRVAEEYLCTVTATPKLQYVSTIEAIRPKQHLVDVVLQAHQLNGVAAFRHSVRAGTDPAMANIKYPNLPGLNTGTGAYDLHSKGEFCVARELGLAQKVALTGIDLFGQLVVA